MLEVQVYDIKGKQGEALKVNEDLFGREVNVALLKQAIVSYHANKRQATAATKSRGMVKGSRRKMFRQKGTGFARRGSAQANILRGGGVAFAKQSRDCRKDMPRKMRRAALRSAILAKIIGGDLVVLEGFKIDEPKTKKMAQLMKDLKIDRSCLLALAKADRNAYLSSRNIADLTVRAAGDLNAFDVATRQKMIITSDAMKALMSQEGGQ